MKSNTFRIVPLPTTVAEAARRAAVKGAPDHSILTADTPTGFPCRHCLRWIEPGERLILFPYASVAPGRPYAEAGPIFVHAEACGRYGQSAEFPQAFKKGRVIRAYNAEEMMIDARVVEHDAPEPLIERLFDNPDTHFLQVRSVTRGCYTMRVERV